MLLVLGTPVGRVVGEMSSADTTSKEQRRGGGRVEGEGKVEWGRGGEGEGRRGSSGGKGKRGRKGVEER